MPRVISRAVRPPRRGAPVKMAPLSVSTEAGGPQVVKAVVTVAATSGPPMVRRVRLAMGQPGVVVDDVEDFHAAAVGEVPVADVGLPALVGQLGAEVFPGGAGPFVGLG